MFPLQRVHYLADLPVRGYRWVSNGWTRTWGTLTVIICLGVGRSAGTRPPSDRTEDTISLGAILMAYSIVMRGPNAIFSQLIL